MRTSKLLAILALLAVIGSAVFPQFYLLQVGVLLICIAHLMNEP